jgi:hypothetical protein
MIAKLMKALYTKLLAIQKDIKALKKDEPNPFYKSHYFTVDSLIAGLRPIISKHGVVVIQPITMQDGKTILSTEVIDADSEDRLVSCMTLPDIADPQKLGAAITYFRRYALTSLFLIEGEEDDDGNTVATTPKKEFHLTPSKEVAPKCTSCGANTKWSTKSGKWYCEKLCWTKPKENLPVINVEQVGNDEIPL